jgi:hypothetical protein
MKNIKHKSVKLNVLLLVLVFLLASCTEQNTDGTVFRIRTDFPEEKPWIEQHLKNSSDVLIHLFNNPEISPPASIKVTIQKDSIINGVAGAATPKTLFFQSDQWPKDRYRLWILAHELSNIFAAHYGCGSYPSDWWSDDRSPFPGYVSCLILEKLGYKQESLWLRNVQADMPDNELYWGLHEKYGFGIFERFFKLIKADKLDLSVIGKPWPQADHDRSLYTAAYLSMAAGVNITNMLIEHNIGKKPSDWDVRHPDVPFIEYSLDPEQVQRIIRIREILAKTPNAKAMKYYRSGNYPTAEQMLNYMLK